MEKKPATAPPQQQPSRQKSSNREQAAVEHSGQGSGSALRKLRQWERSRAALRGIGRPDKPNPA